MVESFWKAKRYCVFLIGCWHNRRVGGVTLTKTLWLECNEKCSEAWKCETIRELDIMLVWSCYAGIW